MFSNNVTTNLKHASGIRAMFEEGENLKKQYGEKNVFDFTLGNPDPEPPAEIRQTLLSLLTSGKPGLHRYMNNAGFADVRERVAAQAAADSGLPIGAEHVVMTVGAAGGLNIVLKSLLNPGNEVLAFAPCFPEYKFYSDNHGASFRMIPYGGGSFQPDPEVLEKNITVRTKVLILNSPNNPTGAIYSAETLMAVSKVIEKRQAELGTTIYVVSDEPYTKLVYDGVSVPDVLTIFKNAIRVTSFSKSLSLPGERIGYVVASPRIDDIGLLMDALIFCNRILGYVNAPALFQKVIAEHLQLSVDPQVYEERRDLLYGGLTAAGYECEKPGGAFYLFPKSPIPDDVAFKEAAIAEKLLIVPGSGFGGPGHFRLSYCVSIDTIERSIPVFEKLIKTLR